MKVERCSQQRGKLRKSLALHPMNLVCVDLKAQSRSYADDAVLPLEEVESLHRGLINHAGVNSSLMGEVMKTSFGDDSKQAA